MLCNFIREVIDLRFGQHTLKSYIVAPLLLTLLVSHFGRMQRSLKHLDEPLILAVHLIQPHFTLVADISMTLNHGTSNKVPHVFEVVMAADTQLTALHNLAKAPQQQVILMIRYSFALNRPMTI